MELYKHYNESNHNKLVELHTKMLFLKQQLNELKKARTIELKIARTIEPNKIQQNDNITELKSQSSDKPIMYKCFNDIKINNTTHNDNKENNDINIPRLISEYDDSKTEHYISLLNRNSKQINKNLKGSNKFITKSILICGRHDGCTKTLENTYGIVKKCIVCDSDLVVVKHLKCDLESFNSKFGYNLNIKTESESISDMQKSLFKIQYKCKKCYRLTKKKN